MYQSLGGAVTVLPSATDDRFIEEIATDGARVGYDERYDRTRIVPSARRRGESADARAVASDAEPDGSR